MCKLKEQNYGFLKKKYQSLFENLEWFYQEFSDYNRWLQSSNDSKEFEEKTGCDIEFIEDWISDLKYELESQQEEIDRYEDRRDYPHDVFARYPEPENGLAY